ncbi:MAG: ribonuclease HI [Bifidobacterium minimum]|nr:ribonuclease HI [Bifidobacterium minimum]
MTITVSTDGSALANPHGPMGWAWADHPHPQGEKGHDHPHDHDAGGATNGTNQIGELCAVLEALRSHHGDEPLVIETDSQYAINCSTTWVRGWKRNGWRNKQGKPVKNDALIKAIDAELHSRPGKVSFVWVKGHAGNAGNEMVDDLARDYASSCRDGSRDGYLPKEGWQSLLASDYATGLTVPPDARLLLDGAIDDRDYHRGRIGEDDPRDGTRKQVEGRTEGTSSATNRDAADADSAGDPIPASSPATHDDGADHLRDGSRTRSEEPPIEPPATRTTQAAVAADGRSATGASLTVSGTLRFSPPPASSPSFDGRPRRIHGVIHIDALVNGDGSMTVDNMPFTMSDGRS